MGFTTWVFLVVGIGLGFVTRPQFDRFLLRSRSSQVHSAELDRTEPVAMPALNQDTQDALAAYYVAIEMNQFRTGFLARTAHELRSPLSSIISLHQLILSDLCEDHEEERECIAQAYDATQKMLALLDSLIMVSKTEYSSSHLQLQPIQLASVLDEVHSLTHLLAQNRNLRLTIDPVADDLYVLSDPRRLQQVLVILCDIPIMLMEDGAIHVSVHLKPHQQVEIWIDDHRPAAAWQEPLDLMKTTLSSDHLMHQLLKDIRNHAALSRPDLRHQGGSPRSPVSVGMALMMCQLLLRAMRGELEVLDTPSYDGMAQTASLNPSGRSRIACLLPLANEQE
jgi:hypothetical protein